ncbi:MAG: tetratricopeptide repeat protein [Deltaproteobacteria bacterium]|nr:tetratricopeptide repeat protein [Deltaproteobacteria bacterium]
MALFVLLLLLFAADPNAAQALLKQGLIALQKGDLPEAQKDLEQASQLDPRNPFVRSSLAELYLRLNQPEKALDAAKAAEADGAGNPVVGRALAIFYTNVFEYAEGLLRSQKFSEAAAVTEAALTAKPGDAQLTLTLGVARYGQRRFDEAITLFLQTIALDPAMEQPYEFLGRVLDQAGSQMPEILKEFEAWAAKNPQNAKAQMLLAKALLAGDPKSQRAKELLQRSISLDDRDWESHYELGVLLESEHDYAGAGQELSRATEQNPKEAIAHYHLARVYDRLGEPERAQAEREIHKRLTAAAGQ